MKCLITGICGKIGIQVAYHFLENGWDVIGFDTLDRHSRSEAAKIKQFAVTHQRQYRMYWVDITQAEQIKKIFQENHIDGVAHLAFITLPECEFHPDKTHRINVGGTTNIIIMTQQYAPRVPFVFASTTSIFDSDITPPDKIVNINDPVKANNHYNADKIACEAMIQKTQLDWRILRFSAVSNPYHRSNKDSLQFALNIRPDTHIEPVHVNDVATAVYRALIKQEAAHKIFIIAGGKRNQMLYKDYLLKVMNSLIGNVQSDDIPWHQDPENVKFSLHWYDTSESQAILQYQTRTVDDYINDMKKSMKWWEKLFIRLMGKRYSIKKIFKQ